MSVANLSERPKTIASLREDHLSLMEAWYDEKRLSVEEKAQRAEATRKNIQKAGKDIQPAKERNEAQGIIDYWASSIAALPEQTYPEILTLHAYSGEAAKDAGEAAAQTFSALPSEEERYVARQLFEKLLVVENGKLKRGPPMLRAVLKQQIGSDLFEDVVAKFEETGALSGLSSDDPESDRLEVSDAGIAENWPELETWLDKISTDNEGFRSILWEAEYWKACNENPQNLADSSRSFQLDKFKGKSDLVDDFIRASQTHQKTRQRKRYAVMTLSIVFLSVAVAALGYGFFVVYDRLEDARVKLATAERKLAEADRVLADVKVDQAVAEAVTDKQDTRNEVPILTDALNTINPALQNIRALTGAMWLGSKEYPQVKSANSQSKFVPIESSKNGTIYRVRGNIYLRTELPATEGVYKSPPSQAIIPAGSLIIVQQKPTGYDRPSGEQYWTKVRVVPKVDIQYTNASKRQIGQLRKTLVDAGFDVPKAVQSEGVRGTKDLVYSNHRSDRRIAAYLAGSLAETNVSAFRNLRCRYLGQDSTDNGRFVLQLWIDFKAGQNGLSPRGETCANLLRNKIPIRGQRRRNGVSS